ncbi:unnamed protein product [Amoebophrya sp. A120]|nr:unnamed protein product [Amoebophrya sp. A120]|eukprot:GSA120T00008365001.1
MVLSPALQVSDAAVQDYVQEIARKNHMLPTLLKNNGGATSLDGAAGPASATPGSSEMTNKKGYVEWGSSKDPPLEDTGGSRRRRRVGSGRPLRYGGTSLENVDRSMPVPTPDGRRNYAAQDYDIDVNVFFPYSGDCIKLTVDPDLPVSAPRTPEDLKRNLLKQKIENYVPGSRENSPSLKNRIADLTGLKQRDIRLLHVQAKSYFRGEHSIGSYGVQHGQTIDMIPHRERPPADEWLNSLPPLKKRLYQNKYLPKLSSSVKKAQVVNREPTATLRKFAKTQKSADPHVIMPRWTTAGRPLGDAASLAKQYAGDASATIYFHNYQPIRERNCLPDACAKIRETFEKQRGYFDKQQKSLSSPTKLASTLRVFMGRPLDSGDVFKAWKISHAERMRDKSEFMRDAAGGSVVNVRKEAKLAKERREGALKGIATRTQKIGQTMSLPDINKTRRLW